MMIAVIDLDSIAYAIGSGKKVLDDQGQPIRVDNKFVYTDKTEEELKLWADFYMRQILDKGKFTHYIGFIKGCATTSRRVAVNHDYKGNRAKEAPSWWQTVKDYLIGSWNAIEAHGHEVDDYVNITYLRLKSSYNASNKVYRVSIDNDLLGLEGTNYNWRKDEWLTVDRDQADRKFWGDMIIGQTVDNIKGLVGKGPAFAAALFEDIELGQLTYREITFMTYITLLGEMRGIHEFYKNYISLKILEDIEGYEAPQPIEYVPINLLEE